MATHYTASGRDDARYLKFEDDTRKLLNDINTKMAVMDTRMAVMEEIQKSNIDIQKRVRVLEIAVAVASEIRPVKVSLWVKLTGVAAIVAILMGLINIGAAYQNKQTEAIETVNLRKQQEEDSKKIETLQNELKMFNDAR